MGTRKHSVGTKDQRDTHLDHRNKPLTLRFSGSTVFKPIKKQGRDNREQLVTFRKLKSRMLLATQKAKCTL